MSQLRNLCSAVLITALLAMTIFAQRQMENSGRGLVGDCQADHKVWTGGRLLGTDPDAIAFNLYRATEGGKAVKLNAQPIANVTNFVDEKADLTEANAYFVRPVIGRREQTASAAFTLPANALAQQYLSILLQTPQGYSPHDASAGDLDGEDEIVLHQAGRGHDNS